MNGFLTDDDVVGVVNGLVRQLEEARESLNELGTMVDDGHGGVKENPAARVERMASAELRGWVKDRPDLFGRRSDFAAGGSSGVGSLSRFKVV